MLTRQAHCPALDFYVMWIGKTSKMIMDTEAALFFRDELRQARAVALRDAEAFEEIVFVLERMGSFIKGGGYGLKDYEEVLCEEAKKSPLASEIPSERRNYHTPFADLLELVRDARNSALHEGSFARHLTTHTIEISLIMEDALMYNSVAVSDFMVRDPVCGYPWQPLSFIRRKMLVNSFSFLPVYADYKGKKDWWVISDYCMAEFLRNAESKTDRGKRLATLLQEALGNDLIELQEPYVCNPDTSIADAIKHLGSLPILVRSNTSETVELVGILTAFDLL